MRKKVITLLILLTVTTLLIAVPADPDAYTITITQGVWLADNNWDFNNNNISDLYIGHVGIGTDLNNPKHRKSMTVLFTSADNQGKLINVNDPTKYFDTQIKWVDSSIGKTTTISTFPYPHLLTNLSWSRDANVTLTILPKGGSTSGYEGTYSTYYRMRFFLDYGTEDQVELEEYEKLFNVLVYYKTKTSPPPGQTYFSTLLVERYPAAENIDLVNLMTFNNPLTVGAVNFTSNDDRPSTSYKITISPNQYHPSGYFAFHKTSSPASSIPFKVYAPSRSTPKQKAFTINTFEKGLSGFWQDFFELAISDVNYNGQTLIGGDYMSEIKIELTID
jgi:hypothetical protein